MSGVSVQAYTPEHADALVGMFHEAVHRSSEYSTFQQEAWAPTPPDLAAWRMRFERTRPRIALHAGTPVGFIERHPQTYIDCCYVAPAFQHRGIATQMVKWVEAQARQAGVAALYVDASLGARPLFERLGFHVERRCHPTCAGVVLRNFAMRKPLL